MEFKVQTKFNVGETAFTKGFGGHFWEVKLLSIMIEIDKNGPSIKYMTDNSLVQDSKEEYLFTKEEKEEQEKLMKEKVK